MVQAHRTSSNLLEPHHHRDSKVWRGLSHEFRVIRLYRTFSIYIVEGETKCAWCLCPSSGWFKHIEPLHYRDSKVWRVLTHEFGVVQPYRNLSINIVKLQSDLKHVVSVLSKVDNTIRLLRVYQRLLSPCSVLDFLMCLVFC